MHFVHPQSVWGMTRQFSKGLRQESGRTKDQPCFGSPKVAVSLEPASAEGCVIFGGMQPATHWRGIFPSLPWEWLRLGRGFFGIGVILQGGKGAHTWESF